MWARGRSASRAAGDLFRSGCLRELASAAIVPGRPAGTCGLTAAEATAAGPPVGQRAAPDHPAAPSAVAPGLRAVDGGRWNVEDFAAVAGSGGAGEGEHEDGEAEPDAEGNEEGHTSMLDAA